MDTIHALMQNTSLTSGDPKNLEDRRMRLFHNIENFKWHVSVKQTTHTKMADDMQVMQGVAFFCGCVATAASAFARRAPAQLFAASFLFTALTPYVFSAKPYETSASQYDKMREMLCRINLEFGSPATPYRVEHTEECLEACRQKLLELKTVEPFVFPWTSKRVLSNMHEIRQYHCRTGFPWMASEVSDTPEESDQSKRKH